MKLRKAEKEALAVLLESGAESAEALAEQLVQLLDELRGARSHHYACAIVAGIPLAIGPYNTRAQAAKAIEKFPAEKKWAIPGWTEEGWLAHLAEVDAKPVKGELSAAEQRKRASAFWGKAMPIRNGEANGLVVSERGPQIRLLKGSWG